MNAILERPSSRGTVVPKAWRKMHEKLPVGEARYLEGEEREDALWDYWRIDAEPGQRRTKLLARLNADVALYDLSTSPTVPMPIDSDFDTTRPMEAM